MNINISKILSRSVSSIIPSKKDLKALLLSGKKLNVYLGIDPTSTKIHLGNAVSLRKLQEFAQLGHKVTFLIGDFTALIGDTSDKLSERPILTYDQIRENFKTYKKQASKVLDFSKVNVKYNSSWLKRLTFSEIIKLCQNFSLNDFIARELIKKRLKEEKKVRLDEVIYPVMQGYDAFILDTDIQIGGADQIFNMQAGRHLLKKIKNKESFILVTKYLEGTDGRKMSKTWNNAIWLEDEPNEMFGKVMSINDRLILNYFEMTTNLEIKEIEKIEINLKKGENPIISKKKLAFEIVKELHSEKKAIQAQDYFEKTFQNKIIPETVDEFKIEKEESILEVLSKFLKSKSQAKRLIQQKAVDVNGKTITNFSHKLLGAEVIRIGKKKFLKVVKL